MKTIHPSLSRGLPRSAHIPPPEDKGICHPILRGNVGVSRGGVSEVPAANDAGALEP